MNTIRLVALATCLLLVSALALTACGGGDDDSDSEDSGDDVAEATATIEAEDETTPEPEEEEDAEPTEEPADEEPDDGGETGGGEAISDPCSLLSQSDVSAALGEEVQEPVVTYTSTTNISGSVQAQVGTCNYVSPSGFSSISLTVYSAPGEDDAISGLAEGACANKEEAGIGDASCWYDDAHIEIQVASGDVYFDMFVTSQNDTTAILESLAATAVGNLP